MLTICKECGLQVSTLAPACPHCGCPANINASNTPLQPLVQTTQPVAPSSSAQTPRSKKRMHLPNGFGSISEIHNRNLRNPYYVKICMGKTPEGRFIYRSLKPKAYFKTYNEAYQALVEYHRNPYDPATDITMQELFDMWYKEKSKTVSADTASKYRTFWRYSESIKDMSIHDIKVHHLKDCVDNSTITHYGKILHITPVMGTKLKNLYNQLFDYAVEYEYLEKNVARLFTPHSECTPQKEHFPFTPEEMDILWQNINTCDIADMVIIQCYMGWRPQELCSLKLADVHLDDGWIQGGMKTKSGKNRQVPIHSKILPLIKARYDDAKSLGSEYLFNHADKRSPTKRITYTYGRYYDRFIEVLPTLGINSAHRCHDPRVHFVTMAKDADMDEYAIKRIVGHTIKDLTERVYTKRTIEWLAAELSKIP